MTCLAKICFTFYSSNWSIIRVNYYTNNLSVVKRKLTLLRYVSIDDHTRRSGFCGEVKLTYLFNSSYVFILKGFMLIYTFLFLHTEISAIISRYIKTIFFPSLLYFTFVDICSFSCGWAIGFYFFILIILSTYSFIFSVFCFPYNLLQSSDAARNIF